MLKRFWRLLASHNLALAVIGLLLLASLLGGTLPQKGRLSPQQELGFQTEWGGVSSWLDMLEFSRVFGSWWFTALSLLLLASLIAGTLSSIGRRYRWYRGEGTGPAHELRGLSHEQMAGLAAGVGFEPGAGSRVEGAAGLFALPLFHFGIAVVVIGGFWSSAVGFGAHLELSEGELYDGRTDKLAVDRGGVMPRDLAVRLRLERVYLELSRHRTLRELQAHFSYQEGEGAVKRSVVETNHPLKLGIYELSPNNTGGYSAVFERIRDDGSRRLMYVHFNVPLDEWNWGGSWKVQRDTLVELDDAPLLYRMTLEGRDDYSLHLTVKRGIDMVFDGKLGVGSEADLGPYRLIFRGVVPWLGFYLASDYPKYMVFSGFAILLAGFLLHLLVYPRRIEVLQEGDLWRVRAWNMQWDWRFEERWRKCSAGLSGEGWGDDRRG